MYQFVDPKSGTSIQLGSKKVGISLDEIATGELYPFFIKMNLTRHMEFLHAVLTKQDPNQIYDTYIDPNAQKAIYITSGERQYILSSLQTPEEQEAVFNAEKEEEDDELFDLMVGDEFEPMTKSFDVVIKDAIRTARADLGMLHHKDFFSSEHFKDYCFSVIGTPAQTAARLGVKDPKGQELLGDLSIAVAVRNKALIAEIGGKFIKNQGTDLSIKDIVKALDSGIKLAERKAPSDWRAKAWANGSFEIAVRQMIDARGAKDKKQEVFNFNTAYKIVTEAIDSTVTKKDLIEEIMRKARDIKTEAKAPDTAGATDAPEPNRRNDPRFELDIGTINKVDWKKFAQVYDIDIDDEAALKDIAMRIVKKGEPAALKSSKTLLSSRDKAKKKRGFTFKNPKHFAAAVSDAMHKRVAGKKVTKPLKASDIPDDESADA